MNEALPPFLGEALAFDAEKNNLKHCPSVEDRQILEELIEDAESKARILLRYQAVMDVSQASDSARKKIIKLWADRLEVCERTVERLCTRVELEGVATLAKLTRVDAGVIKGSKQWKGKTVEEWVKFIEDTYKKYNSDGRSMSRNQVFLQVKGHAENDLGLTDSSEYPALGTVYNVLKPLIESKKKKRNPGQGPGIVIKVLDTQGNEEEIVVERSNQVWQIDHTRLDNLLTDANGELAGDIWTTAIIDTYASYVMGNHLGFANPGSHEVALALRHAILQKHYGAEYKLREKWEACGLPEYIVTDRAKEFKSAHLRRVALDLGIKLRLRLYTEQGAVIERLFLSVKNEFSSKLPGFRGGSLKERPDNPEKYACVCYEEYERLLVRHIVDHRNTHLYPRVKKQTCQERWQNGLIGGTPRMPSSEHDLDVCLMKSTERTIQLYGCIEFECIVYGAGWRKDEKGLWRYNKDEDFLKDYEGKVVLRYNPSNIVYLYVYTKEVNGQPSRYLGTIRAKHSQERDLYRDEERLSLKEWKDRKKKRSEETKSVDQSSTVAEQRDLTKFSDDKVEEHKKRRRKRKTREVKKDEQARITRNSKQSNVIEFPSATSSSDDTWQGAENNQPKVETTTEVEVTPLPKGTKIEAKPALFVVQDLNKFMESDW